VVVFCDSEFWHGKNFESARKSLKRHEEYWVKKIERNIERDHLVNAELAKQGYVVKRYWGLEITKDLPRVVEEILSVLREKGYPGL
jgi:DNA G:T-mismatch repair endonuclease